MTKFTLSPNLTRRGKDENIGFNLNKEGEISVTKQEKSPAQLLVEKIAALEQAVKTREKGLEGAAELAKEGVSPDEILEVLDAFAQMADAIKVPNA